MNKHVNESLLVEIFSRGLCRGLTDKNTNPEPMFCVEAAIAIASGEGVMDHPSCVAVEDRSIAIALNDLPWKDPHARAEGMLGIALAQIGTRGLRRSGWVRGVVVGFARRALPFLFRHGVYSDDEEGLKQAKAWEEKASTLEEGWLLDEVNALSKMLVGEGLMHGLMHWYHWLLGDCYKAYEEALDLSGLTHHAAVLVARMSTDFVSFVLQGKKQEAVSLLASIVIDAYKAEGRA
jgi:hypothetical protein